MGTPDWLKQERDEALSAIEAAHDKRVALRKKRRREMEIQIEAEVEEYYKVEVRLMAEAERMGISKTRIGRAVGTSNWQTIESMLEIGRELIGVNAPVEASAPFQWVGLTVRGSKAWAFLQPVDDFPAYYRGDDLIPEGEGWPFVRPDTMLSWMPWHNSGMAADSPPPTAEAIQWAEKNNPEG